MSGSREILISPRQRRELLAFIAEHPGLTHAGLLAEADRAVMRMLITDGMAETRHRYLVRVDDDGHIWPA
ncbi:hypothetical protein ACFVYV_40290 [Streptomyces mirabilis]|uniref:hypothetical protein n=1 Tax=Streptomyces mirabilis TaxID=68239 RepID=UPI0036DD408D